MIFRRRKQQHQQIRQASEEADQHLQRAQELAAETSQLADDLRETRLRNHFGEAIVASFQPKRKKGFPWAH